jgi:hypothetical protein
MAWGSTVPAALDALVVLFQQELPGVTVFDGPDTSGSSQDEALLVGVGDSSDPTAVDGHSTREGLAVARDREQYAVRCALIVLNGSGDIAAARRRAYDLLGAVGGVLAADTRLGGTVMTAQIGTQTFSQQQTQQGAEAVIAFTVEIDAYSRR